MSILSSVAEDAAMTNDGKTIILACAAGSGGGGVALCPDGKLRLSLPDGTCNGPIMLALNIPPFEVECTFDDTNDCYVSWDCTTGIGLQLAAEIITTSPCIFQGYLLAFPSDAGGEHNGVTYEPFKGPLKISLTDDDCISDVVAPPMQYFQYTATWEDCQWHVVVNAVWYLHLGSDTWTTGMTIFDGTLDAPEYDPVSSTVIFEIANTTDFGGTCSLAVGSISYFDGCATWSGGEERPITAVLTNIPIGISCEALTVAECSGYIKTAATTVLSTTISSWTYGAYGVMSNLYGSGLRIHEWSDCKDSVSTTQENQIWVTIAREGYPDTEPEEFYWHAVIRTYTPLHCGFYNSRYEKILFDGWTDTEDCTGEWTITNDLGTGGTIDLTVEDPA
jgi:hypothetical protein